MLEREGPEAPAVVHHMVPPPPFREMEVPHKFRRPQARGKRKKPERAEGKYITSPMVGTFYSSPFLKIPTLLR